jgi:type VI secretion system protein ImpJ
MLGRLVERLEQKAATLRTERAGRSSPEAAGGDLVRFWLAHAVHSGLAPLRHHLRTGSAHPEELYGELVRLAGALCTFAMDADPGDLPAYDHENLERTFSALEGGIGTHLDVVIPEQSLRVPLESREPFFSLADLQDPRSLQRGARWFLGVRSEQARSELLRDVPRLVKVCSGDGIRKLVDRGLEGLPMRHLPSPPPSLAPRIGTEYFLLHPTGPCWKLIERSRSVGIYVPGALGDAEVDLTVVLETAGD